MREARIYLAKRDVRVVDMHNVAWDVEHFGCLWATVSNLDLQETRSQYLPSRPPMFPRYLCGTLLGSTTNSGVRNSNFVALLPLVTSGESTEVLGSTGVRGGVGFDAAKNSCGIGLEDGDFASAEASAKKSFGM